MKKTKIMSYADEKKYKKLCEYAKIIFRMNIATDALKILYTNKLIAINAELKNIKNKYRS